MIGIGRLADREETRLGDKEKIKLADAKDNRPAEKEETTSAKIKALVNIEKLADAKHFVVIYYIYQY